MDLLPDLAPLVDRPGQVEALDSVDGAVERHPGEDLRVREVASRAAHLPDPLVAAVPRALEDLHQVVLERPGVVVGGKPVRARLVQRVHHLAVDVELELAVRGVPNPDRTRAFVPGEPVELVLAYATLPTDPVEDLCLRGVAGDRAQQPVAPRARLVDEP